MPASWRPRWRALALLAWLAAAAPSAARVLVVGDGTALGDGVRPGQAWTSRLQRQTGRVVQVFGAPGAAIADPLLGLGALAECLFFDIGPVGGVRAAVFALGAHDAHHDPDAVRAGTRRLLAWVRAPWVCVTPPRRPAEPDGLARVREVIAEECAAIDAAVIDGEALLSDGDWRDGIRLDPGGHAKLARAVREALRRVAPRVER